MPRCTHPQHAHVLLQSLAHLVDAVALASQSLVDLHSRDSKHHSMPWA
jgi:hypothetical protein